jgi:hypothetical protein
VREDQLLGKIVDYLNENGYLIGTKLDEVPIFLRVNSASISCTDTAVTVNLT